MIKALSVLMPYLAGELDLAALDEQQWSLLFAEARSAGLQARVSAQLVEDGHLSLLPFALQLQANANLVRISGFHRDVVREIHAIETVLRSLNTRRFLLKGAAYVHWQLPPMAGRFFSDIDLLVPLETLPEVESALMLSGWVGGKLSDYDQRYYRVWAHEIPPMTHIRRGTTIDLHHSLVMPTCRLAVDSAAMIANGQIGLDGWWRLSDVDLLLHSVAHLLLNSEFSHGLRDLSDIDLLYRHFVAENADFSCLLEARANEIGLIPLLYGGAYLSNQFFRTPFPEKWWKKSTSFSVRLLVRSCSVRHPETKLPGQFLCDLLLSVREVYYRLPFNLLIRHLLHKASSALHSLENNNPV